MRRIISKAEEDKKKRINQFLVGGILILIMVLSVLGYSSMGGGEEDNEKVIYKGIEFTKESNLWNAKISGLQFYFKYNPQEIEEIKTTMNSLENYKDRPLYIYSENPEAEIEVYRNLFYYNRIVERAQNACPEGDEGKCEESSPIKSCENNFIIIRENNDTMIRQQENCVFIEGKNEDLVKLSDSFLFKIIGV